MFRQGSTCLVLLWILLALIRFRLRDFHPLWSDFPIPFFYPLRYTLQSKPHIARNMVWALSISLAATLEIDVSFSSSGYLDVSVHRVPFHTLWEKSSFFRTSFFCPPLSGSNAVERPKGRLLVVHSHRAHLVELSIKPANCLAQVSRRLFALGIRPWHSPHEPSA